MTYSTNSFYCVSCRKKKTVYDDEICVKTLKNGVPALKSSCPSCGTNLTKFISFDKKAALTKRFGKC